MKAFLLFLTFLSQALANDFRIHNWGLHNIVTNSHIEAIKAWGITTGSNKVVVAVVDTGLDVTHPFVKNNVLYSNNIYGWDFTKNQSNPTDDHGHGTHVAGIITSVAPSVSIVAVKYYSASATGDVNLKQSIKALKWAIDNNVHIINFSGGGPAYSNDEYNLLRLAKRKGILVVVSAGNERQDVDDINNNYYPCSYKLSNIICVGSSDIAKHLHRTSNWGKKTVDVVAPGANILSALPNNMYAYMSGTSQATAFVSGVAALLLSVNPKLKPDQIKKIINKTVDVIPELKEKIKSTGKINAYSALLEGRGKLK